MKKKISIYSFIYLFLFFVFKEERKKKQMKNILFSINQWCYNLIFTLLVWKTEAWILQGFEGMEQHGGWNFG